MAPAKTTSQLTLIDSADEHGRVCCYIPNNDPVRTNDHSRDYLSTVFTAQCSGDPAPGPRQESHYGT